MTPAMAMAALTPSTPTWADLARNAHVRAKEVVVAAKNDEVVAEDEAVPSFTGPNVFAELVANSRSE
jgi:hypothetical protein